MKAQEIFVVEDDKVTQKLLSLVAEALKA